MDNYVVVVKLFRPRLGRGFCCVPGNAPTLQQGHSLLAKGRCPLPACAWLLGAACPSASRTAGMECWPLASDAWRRMRRIWTTAASCRQHRPASSRPRRSGGQLSLHPPGPWMGVQRLRWRHRQPLAGARRPALPTSGPGRAVLSDIAIMLSTQMIRTILMTRAMCTLRVSTPRDTRRMCAGPGDSVNESNAHHDGLGGTTTEG